MTELNALHNAADWLRSAQQTVAAARHEVYTEAVKAVKNGNEKQVVAKAAGVSRVTLNRVLANADMYVEEEK